MTMCLQNLRELYYGFSFHSLNPFFYIFRLIHKLQVKGSKREGSYPNIPTQE